jgi:hypothetical protein
MAEWSKAHAWKVCKPQKGFMGSNPILSAFAHRSSDLSERRWASLFKQVLLLKCIMWASADVSPM